MTWATMSLDAASGVALSAAVIIGMVIRVSVLDVCEALSWPMIKLLTNRVVLTTDWRPWR